MSGNWSAYLPSFIPMLAFFSLAVLSLMLSYFKSKKDDNYLEKRNNIIQKITISAIIITSIIGLVFQNISFPVIIGLLVLELLPSGCFSGLMYSIEKYVKIRKTNDIDERKKLKKNLIAAVIVTSLEFIMFIFLIVVVLGVLRGMT